MNNELIYSIVSNKAIYSVIALAMVFSGMYLYVDAEEKISELYGSDIFQNQMVGALIATESISSNEISIDTETAPKAETPVNIETAKENFAVASDNADKPAPPTETMPVVVPLEEVRSIDINTGTSTEVVDEVVVVEEYSVDEQFKATFTLPYIETNFQSELSLWSSGYGNVEFVNGNLVIGGGQSDTAFLALIEETIELDDYEFNVIADWNRGKSFQLVGRFSNYGNFVTCSFGVNGSSATIISTIDGERAVLGSSPALPSKVFEGWKDLSFGLRVAGDSFSCLKDGEVVLQYKIPEMSDKGSVGIALWSELPGEALATIKETSITALTN